jgi:opacity protein-like surface antigen
MKPLRLVTSSALLLAFTVLSGGRAAAQESSGEGFLFGAPKVNLTLRMGYAAPSASSDLFSFVTKELSLRKGDFAGFSYGLDVAMPLRPQLELVLSADINDSKTTSDYREWQDTQGLPIEQTTSFARQSLAANIRYYLRPYGRSLSRLAWVPASYAPWISAGIGRTHYRFHQTGDFVDFTNGNSVFPDTYTSSEWGFTPQVAAGIDWNLNTRVAVTTQARYLWGKADLGSDFSGFNPIDLSGLGLTGGLTFRF